MFGRFGMGELLIILVVVLLIFGPTKLPALAKSMGQAVKEFRKGTQEVEEGLNKLANEPAAESKPAAPAASAQTQTTTQETK
ncbi:MAG: twin-arginine translocase TatA/TatE family subunit [Angelakisella sp.]|jgi:sec-independent protein translocase protein TatA|nr:twin-arginine translocase TatA/TatE family subunit [Angelakisella sp.]